MMVMDRFTQVSAALFLALGFVACASSSAWLQTVQSDGYPVSSFEAVRGFITETSGNLG